MGEKRKKEEGEMKSKEKDDKLEEDKVEADTKLKEEAEEEAKQTNHKKGNSLSAEEANKKEQEVFDDNENQEIEREKGKEDAEMSKLICENNIIENVHDQSQEKIGTETTDSIVDVVSNVETLIDGKLKEDDVDDGASSGK